MIRITLQQSRRQCSNLRLRAAYHVINPATQEVLYDQPFHSESEIDAIIDRSHEAFLKWKDVPIQQRVRVMLKYQALIREHTPDLSRIINEEHGKSIRDAEGDVFRGLEVVEHACAASSLLTGQTVENLASNTDTYSYRHPLGVCAGIAPFNFPAMIPLWMFPMATVSGNSYILKPSELVPGCSTRLLELALEAGLPENVLQLVHGDQDAVTQLCEDERIKAISFVGSNRAGEAIYKMASNTGKRVQCNMGAKNHAVVLPDADLDLATKALVSAACGSSGQRCMALSVGLLVGSSDTIVDNILKEAANLTVGIGDKDVSPMVHRSARDSVASIIEQSEAQGATVLLDGRKQIENDTIIGPSVLMVDSDEYACVQEEIFGPVLVLRKVDSLETAIDIINKNEYGNGTAIFTESGSSARYFQRNIEAGQVGINVPVPVPLPMFSFTGNKASMWGTANFYGKSGFDFFTQQKTITSNWNRERVSTLDTAMPVL